MRKKYLLAAAVALSSLAVGGFVLQSSLSGDARAARKGEQGTPAASSLTMKSVTEDPVAPAVVPKDHDVTMVMFFDYQCPVCRRVHPDVRRLIAEDKRVRLLYRDWPIFGAASIEAARAAIASQYQGKHAAFDDALMRMQGRLSSETIRAAAGKAGVDWARLQADLKAHDAEITALLARNSAMAPAIGLQGTPGFIIGPYLVPGGMDLAGLKRAVALARANRNPARPAASPAPARR